MFKSPARGNFAVLVLHTTMVGRYCSIVKHSNYCVIQYLDLKSPKNSYRSDEYMCQTAQTDYR